MSLFTGWNTIVILVGGEAAALGDVSTDGATEAVAGVPVAPATPPLGDALDPLLQAANARTAAAPSAESAANRRARRARSTAESGLEEARRSACVARAPVSARADTPSWDMGISS
jgi:hypothetical protein